MKLNWLERWFVDSPFRYGLQRLVIQWFKNTLPLKSGANLLEIGCGRGAGARLILDSFRPQKIYLMDLDIRMIRKAKMFLGSGTQKNIIYCVGDATRIPFEDICFDAVFGFGFLHHVPAWREGLAEIARVLKPEGVYFIEEFYPSLYQNFITKRLLAHPEQDRFNSRDLHVAFTGTDLSLVHTFELKRLGILAICVKTEGKSYSCKEFSSSCRLSSD